MVIEIEYSFTLMLEDRKIQIWSYNVETIIAEKFEAIVKRGVLSTRIRDYYDVYMLINTQNKIIDKKNWEFLWLREFSWFVENTEVYATTKEYQDKFLGFNIVTKNRLCINGDEYTLADDSDYENNKLNEYCIDKSFLKNFVKKKDGFRNK